MEAPPPPPPAVVREAVSFDLGTRNLAIARVEWIGFDGGARRVPFRVRSLEVVSIGTEDQDEIVAAVHRQLDERRDRIAPDASVVAIERQPIDAVLPGNRTVRPQFVGVGWTIESWYRLRCAFGSDRIRWTSADGKLKVWRRLYGDATPEPALSKRIKTDDAHKVAKYRAVAVARQLLADLGADAAEHLAYFDSLARPKPAEDAADALLQGFHVLLKLRAPERCVPASRQPGYRKKLKARKSEAARHPTCDLLIDLTTT